MTYEDLWAAQVRTKAEAFSCVYGKLQHLIKSRTKAGNIHGNYQEDIPMGSGLYQLKEWDCDGSVIKVRSRIFRGRLIIHFVTKR